jgi:hypothetical protein
VDGHLAENVTAVARHGREAAPNRVLDKRLSAFLELAALDKRLKSKSASGGDVTDADREQMRKAWEKCAAPSDEDG